ncbi:MAG: hypothetical protein O2800_04080 [Planctomycetota bacterium]|nr:hypothetical protein [Planctomycetota bacterium]
MHILTKIFVVLVTLLAVATVPFVVVQSANEAEFKSRYESEKSGGEAARADLSASRAQHARIEADLQAQLTASESKFESVLTELQTVQSDLQQAEQSFETLKGQKAQLEASIAVLAESDRARGALIESLSKELGQIRDRAVDSERQLVEVRKTFEIVSSNFDAAQSAQLALQEEIVRLHEEQSKEIVRLREEQSKAALSVAVEVSDSGTELVGIEVVPGVHPNKDVVARVTDVRRVGGTTYAAIDQGQRSGVEVGWIMAVADGETYIADLRIVRIDANEAVGIVQGESDIRGLAAVGQTVVARPGE